MKCKECKMWLSELDKCPIPTHMLREGNGCKLFEKKEEFGE